MNTTFLLSAPTELKDRILALNTIPQSKSWHPEGNVLIHTTIVVNRAKKSNNINLLLAALFHDIGKFETTKPNNKGGFSAHGHEDFSAKSVDKFSSWIKSIEGADIETIKWIVLNHMRIKFFNEMKTKKQRQLQEHPAFDLLLQFKEFDTMKTLNTIEVHQAGGNIFKFWWNKIVHKSKKK